MEFLRYVTFLAICFAGLWSNQADAQNGFYITTKTGMFRHRKLIPKQLTAGEVNGQFFIYEGICLIDFEHQRERWTCRKPTAEEENKCRSSGIKIYVPKRGRQPFALDHYRTKLGHDRNALAHFCPASNKVKMTKRLGMPVLFTYEPTATEQQLANKHIVPFNGYYLSVNTKQKNVVKMSKDETKAEPLSDDNSEGYDEVDKDEE